MNKGIECPITEGELEGAAHLCLRAAAYTDRDGLGPGTGIMAARRHHARRRRFEEAREKMLAGITSLPELGITHEDCEWVINEAGALKKKAGAPKKTELLTHFTATKDELKKLEEEIPATL